MPDIHYNMETDEIIRRVRRMELANIQKPRKRDFRAGVEIHKNSRGSKSFRSISMCYFPRQLTPLRRFRFYHRSPSQSSNKKKIWLNLEWKFKNKVLKIRRSSDNFFS